jgi:hypothetical protein
MFVPHSELDLKKMFDELEINSLDDLLIILMILQLVINQN